jgi:hypothetical protein
MLRRILALEIPLRTSPPILKMKNASKRKTKEVFKLGWKANPKYDDATHAIWYVGQESWESFCKREFGKVRPNPFSFDYNPHPRPL